MCTIPVVELECVDDVMVEQESGRVAAQVVDERGGVCGETTVLGRQEARVLDAVD